MVISYKTVQGRYGKGVRGWGVFRDAALVERPGKVDLNALRAK